MDEVKAKITTAIQAIPRTTSESVFSNLLQCATLCKEIRSGRFQRVPKEGILIVRLFLGLFPPCWLH